MDREIRHQKVAKVAKELGPALRRQARGQWETVKTAERNEGNRHVWRFRPNPDGPERFLHVAHEVMVKGDDPAAELLRQLQVGQWIERLTSGPETALLLSKGGRLEAWPAH
jgi:hypothetical protein